TIAMFLSVAIVRPTGEANELFCPTEVEAAFAADIAANAPGSPSESAVHDALAARTLTAKQMATNYGYLDFNPERVSARVECSSAVTGIAVGRALAFAMGATFSAAVGFIGMNMAVQGN